MRICQKLSARPDRLSIQKRLTYSNILMFLIPVAVTLISALRAQVPAFRALEEVREEQEKAARPPSRIRHSRKTAADSKAANTNANSCCANCLPSERAQRPRLQDWLFRLAAFYGITLAERLYKTAVRHELNRALWPILGLVLNLFALPLLLVALCDPKRAQKQV